jgi:hypothetical protein
MNDPSVRPRTSRVLTALSPLLVGGLLLTTSAFVGCSNEPTGAVPTAEVKPDVDAWKADPNAKVGPANKNASEIMQNPKGKKGAVAPQ